MNINDAVKMLSECEIEEAENEVRLLCEKFLSIPMSRSLIMRYDELDKMDGFGEFKEALEKRLTRYPMQYILGEWEFYGMPMRVGEGCLIPRPDTELVAERAVIELKKQGKKEKYRCLDLCTGSGCIAIAVMYQVKQAEFTLVDISDSALKTARENLVLNGVTERARVLRGDAMTRLFEGEKFDLITANPPYIPEKVMAGLEPELSYEPRIALTDGGDGLSFYRAIVEMYKNALTDNGSIIFEHGYDQYEAVSEIAKSNGMSADVIMDYGKRKRGAVLKNLH